MDAEEAQAEKTALETMSMTPHGVFEFMKICPPSVTVNLKGPPGIGKTAIIKKVRDYRMENRKSSKPFLYKNIAAVVHLPEDFLAISTQTEFIKFKVCDWWANMSKPNDVDGMLFIDELASARPAVLMVMLRMAWERALDDYELCDGVQVITCGNRKQDRAGANMLPKQLANRMVHLEVRPDFDEWRSMWAHEYIHPLVIGFIMSNTDLFFQFDPQRDDDAFPSPRTWEILSRLFVAYEGEVPLPVIAGTIGASAANTFHVWLRVRNLLPKVEDAFDAPEQTAKKVSKKPDVMYAYTSMVVQGMKKFLQAKNKDKNVDKLTTFCEALREHGDPEFARLLFHECMITYGSSFNESLAMSPVFRDKFSLEYMKYIPVKSK